MDAKVLTTQVPLQLAKEIEDLTAWVGQEDGRHHLTLDGMADVTAERVVDQADVEAWALSLSTANALPVPQR